MNVRFRAHDIVCVDVDLVLYVLFIAAGIN